MFKYRLYKDSIIRKKYQKKENLLKFCKFVSSSQYIVNNRLKLKLSMLILPKNTSYHNFCIISGRSRGLVKNKKISRIQLRLLGSFGYVTGLSK